MKLVAAIIVSMTSLLLQTSTGSAFVSVPQPPHCVVTKTPSCHRNNKKNGFQLRAFFEKELGAQPPLGFFDPLGLVADGDADKFDRYRYCEIKHGRIAMLAILGYIVQETGTRLPGNIDYSGKSFADIPNGLAALNEIPQAGLLQILLFIGVLELFVMKDVIGTGEFPGDFRNGFIDFGWDTFSPEEQDRKRAIELNQGRAAMMGVLALIVHEKIGVPLLPPPFLSS